MALGLTLGVVFAVSSGGHTTNINQSALGAAATPSASASAGAAASASPTAAAAAPAVNMNCVLIVPANPLSAQGLATPYQLTGPGGMTPAASGCNMANAAVNGTFVQATIINPRTGQLAVYNPLVITQGTTPAAAPVVPKLPAGAVVEIVVGNNGTNLTLQGATANTLANANCVNGLNGVDFGEYSYCNGANFYQTAFRDIARGRTVVPPLGVGTNGVTCPTTRSFNVVDQDQSDNVTTTYLINGNGQTAQSNAANAAALAGATTLVNPSDNLVVDAFIDKAIGCTPFMAPDLGNNNTPTTSYSLDELQAAKFQQAPIALVPMNDPMTLQNAAFSTTKTNLYRVGAGQPPISAAQVNDTPANYCKNLVNLQPQFLTKVQTALANFTSPVAAVGTNLFTFLSARLSASFAALNCANFGLTNPVTLTLNGNGAATAATFNLNPQTPTAAGGTAAAGAGGMTSGATGNPVPAHHKRHGQRAGGA